MKKKGFDGEILEEDDKKGKRQACWLVLAANAWLVSRLIKDLMNKLVEEPIYLGIAKCLVAVCMSFYCLLMVSTSLGDQRGAKVPPPML